MSVTIQVARSHLLLLHLNLPPLLGLPGLEVPLLVPELLDLLPLKEQLFVQPPPLLEDMLNGVGIHLQR